MKKIFITIMIFILVFSFVGCGNSESTNSINKVSNENETSNKSDKENQETSSNNIVEEKLGDIEPIIEYNTENSSNIIDTGWIKVGLDNKSYQPISELGYDISEYKKFEKPNKEKILREENWFNTKDYETAITKETLGGYTIKEIIDGTPFSVTGYHHEVDLSYYEEEDGYRYEETEEILLEANYKFIDREGYTKTKTLIIPLKFEKLNGELYEAGISHYQEYGLYDEDTMFIEENNVIDNKEFLKTNWFPKIVSRITTNKDMQEALIRGLANYYSREESNEKKSKYSPDFSENLFVNGLEHYIAIDSKDGLLHVAASHIDFKAKGNSPDFYNIDKLSETITIDGYSYSPTDILEAYLDYVGGELVRYDYFNIFSKTKIKPDKYTKTKDFTDVIDYMLGVTYTVNGEEKYIEFDKHLRKLIIYSDEKEPSSDSMTFEFSGNPVFPEDTDEITYDKERIKTLDVLEDFIIEYYAEHLGSEVMINPNVSTDDVPEGETINLVDVGDYPPNTMFPDRKIDYVNFENNGNKYPNSYGIALIVSFD